MKTYLYRCLLACLLCATTAATLSAQALRTAYFMNNAVVRTDLNPAFQPERSFYSIPVVGSLAVGAQTNGLTLDNLLYLSKDGELHTFLYPDLTAEDFLKNVKVNNNFDINIQTDIFTAGWRMLEGYCTVGAALKANTSFRVPKALFEFVKEANGNYDISGLQADLQTYLELSAGYSRALDDRLTVGGKIKLLPALAGAKANFDTLLIDMRSEKQWVVTSVATLHAALAGTDIKDGEDGYIDDIEFSAGLAGFGAAIDMGATYQLLDNLTLSAALLDLGFIAWTNATAAKSTRDFTFDGLGDLNNNASSDEEIERLKENLQGLAHFEVDKQKSYTSRLAASALAGAEYNFLDRRLSAGLLSSTRFNPSGTYTELTLSANYRPINWFAASLSYSALHSNFKTYGIAINFAPKGFNFFLGSDYMLTKITPQFVPINATAANLYLGMSVWL